MAYIGVGKWEGDPDELAKVFKEHLEPAAALVAEQYGSVLSIHARTDDGIITVSIVESVEQSMAMHDDPRFRPAFEKLMELPPPTLSLRAEVFGLRISERAHELTTHEPASAEESA
jgi:hypothetical protein